MNGYFITFEGGEGTGKSTQAQLLVEALQEKGIATLLTREPGGSAGAEAIRQLLVTGEANRWDAMTETLLLVAARRDHWIKVIQPALEEGKTVICDRFTDSTLVYQGLVGGVPLDLIQILHEKALPGSTPNKTFLFDIDPEVGLARALSRGGTARFEAKGLDFHRRVRDAYLSLARQFSQRYVLIDACQEREDIFQRIKTLLTIPAKAKIKQNH